MSAVFVVTKFKIRSLAEISSLKFLFVFSRFFSQLHEANLYQKYVNAANVRNFSADILKNNDEQSLQRNLFGLAHLPFQIFNDHVDHGSMKNK